MHYTSSGIAITVVVAVVVVYVGFVAIDAVGEQYIEERQEKSALGNETYGVGNWTWEVVGCGDLCVYAPRPISDSVPNASVKVPPTEDDLCYGMFCGWGESWPKLLAPVGIIVGAVLAIGLGRRLRADGE